MIPLPGVVLNIGLSVATGAASYGFLLALLKTDELKSILNMVKRGFSGH
jgi:hypothetical protein